MDALKAWFAASDVTEQTLIALRAKDDATLSYHLRLAGEDLAALAAALGYRIEKITEQKEAK